MSEIFRESEIALEKKGPAQESFLRLRQDQRRRDTHAAFHHAAVGRHRITLQQHSVRATRGHEDRVAPVLDYFLIGGPHLAATRKRRLAFFAVDPQRQP